MYHIVASDLDGTLLNPEHKLSDYTKKTLQALTRYGVHFVFATGRHHIDVGQMRDAMDIDAFMITSNGARVHNSHGELVFSHNLDSDIVQELAQFIPKDSKVTTNIYNGDIWLTNREDEDSAVFFQESVFNYQIYDPNNIPSDDVAKVYFSANTHEELLPFEDALNARYGDSLNISFSSLTCLEVMAGGVSKGTALAQVAKMIGHGLKDCIAFGDGMNDVEMLSMAGKGCIMGNAQQRLKDRLPHLEVIGYNKDDAVPHYLEKLYLNK